LFRERLTVKTAENKKRMKNKHKFRWGRVLWKAFKVATLLIIFTWLFKKLRGSKAEKTKPSTASYAKIEEGQSMQNLAPSDPHPPQYQAPAQKYEPMGYSGYYAPPPAAATSSSSSSVPPPPQPQTVGVSPMPTPPPQQQQQPYPQFAPPTTAPPATATGANADYYNAGPIPTPPSTVASTVSGVQPTYQANLYQPPPGGYYQPPPPHQ
jgi:hypothetical protein